MLHIAMTFVANDGVSEVGKMFADLMPTSSFQLRFNKREPRRFMAQPNGVVYLRSAKAFEMGNGLKWPLAGVGVVERVVNSTRFRHPTAHDGEVFFLHGFVHDLLAKQPGGFGIFTKN